MLRRLSAWDSYLPTHPASLMPGLPQLAWLLGWLFILAILWVLARLLLSVVFTRFLHAHLSIGRIGWASLNDIEWSLVRHARGTTSAKIQKVTVQRIALTLRGRGPKDNDIRLAWLGLTIKGVKVTICLAPSRNQDGDASIEDDNDAGNTSPSHRHERSPSPSSPRSPHRQAFTTTPSFSNLTFSDKANIPPQSSQRPTSVLRQLAQFSYYSIRAVHDVRRRVRRLIIQSIPEAKRRTLNRNLNLTLRFFRHRIVAPALTQINTVGRSCNVITIFLALEITDVTIDVPQVKTQLQLGLLRVGGELVRRNRSYVGLWARLEQLVIIASELPADCLLPPAKTAALAGRALEMPGPLLVEAQANFDPAIGMAALYHRTETGALEPRKTILDLSFSFMRPSKSFGKDEKINTTSTAPSASSGGQSSSIKARLNTLLEIAERVKNTLDPHPHPHFGPHMGLHLHSRELSSDQETRSSTPHSRSSSDAAPYEHEHLHHTFDSSRERPIISARRNPAAMLKSIFFRVPLVKIQAKLPELGEASRTAIAASQQIHVELRLRGLAAEAVISKTLSSDDRHLHWFGKNLPLKLAAKAGFEKFDIDAATTVSTTGSLDRSLRVLEVSPSGLHLSSSWLPPRVDALFREQPRVAQFQSDLAASMWGGSVEPTSPVRKQDTVSNEDGEADDRCSGLVVLEADIGGVNGEASLEVIQGLLLIAAAHRAKRAALKQTLDEESDRQTEEGELHTSWQAYSPPTLASVIEFGRCGYRILGPKLPHRATFGPGEDDAELSPGFSAPSFICVQILSLAITLQTRYADIPLHRTEAQRRELKQEIKRGSIFIPNVLFRGSQSQRTSEARAKEARQRMFESPRLDEEHEEWSQSLSPTTPVDTPGLDAKLPFSDRDKARMGVPLSASFYRENDFLCFITPDDGHMPEYARRLAASHAGGQQEVLDHPFVYFLDASVTCRKVDVYLIEPRELQNSEPRSNPTSASSATFSSTHADSGTPRSRSSIPQARGQRHTRRQSRPATTKRYDLLSLDSVELAAALEVLGRELSVGEPAHDESAFMSSVDSQDAHGTISLIFDGIRAEASNLSVHHCISAMLHLKSEQPTTDCDEDTETLVNSTFLSSSLDSDPSATAVPSTASPQLPSPTPLAQLLPPNVSFSVGFTAVEVLAAGPDPKFMPGTCRGLALKVSQLTLQRYRQDRYVVNQAHAHVRAPLGLPPDVRAHAQSVFNSTGDKDQAYATLHLRGLQVNPLVDLGKIVRAKPPVNGQGRNTTADVEVETIQAWKWCSLPRDHFFAGNDEQAPSPPVTNSHKRDRNYKARVKTNPARVRDFIFVDTLETRITMWARPAGRKSDSKAGSGNSGHRNGLEDAGSTVKQDHVGLVIRVPSVVIRFELFQIYCCLLAISTLRSLKPAKDGDKRVKRTNPRIKPLFQLKCNVPQVHVYCTLPHKVKLYMNLRRVEVSTHKEDLQFEIESGTLAGESHICRGLWEDIVKFRKWTLLIKKDPDLSAARDRSITLKGEGGRLRIPCKYPFSEIVDNVATFVKLTKQLTHQFIKGKFSSAIEPRSEGPKHLPDIRIALGILVLEAADDLFEAKLNLVWRAGISQQAHRLRQEEIFEDKMRAVREQESIAREEQARAALHLPSEGTTLYSDNVANSAHDSTAPPMLQTRPPNPSRLRERLRREHARQWIKTYRDAQAHRLRDEEAHLKRLYGNVRSNDDELPVQLLNHHGNTPLMRVVFGKVDLKLSKPSFDVDGNGLPDYLHDVGKGVPRNTEYSLLIPFHLDWRMNEAKAHIRDYPIPLLDIPPFVDDSKTAEEDAHSWHLSTDFVIAEELADSNAIRHVSAIVVPPEASGHNAPTEGYYFRVPRTAMPIKFYALPVVTIKSDSATRLCWGNSIQPAIQDVMRVMDSLTKPPPDPSERLGFWDKIRLILHWQVQINFEGKGPLHLILKGSRDPYQVEGIGAGFSLSWHDDVKWKIGFDNPDREFFQIFSDRFVLGVPDLGAYDIKSFSGQMRERPSGEDHLPATFTAQPKVKASQNRDQKLSKVCAKFQGGVRWGLGMQFERTCRPETCNCGCEGTAFHRKCRLFDFRPHYEVRTISGLDAAGIDLSKHDSYRGFRSDFIHFSISVLANRPGSPANTLHLTPHGFDHFSAWWHLFDGTLSLPIRHGAVFESSLPPSKKFGKHCATIKYRIQLAPVYIAHTYKQEHLHDMRKGFSTVLGVKGRLESFNVDMHQREQETRTRKGDSAEVKVRLHKAFHRVEVDCKDTELRVLSARFVSSAPLEGETDSEEADINDFIDMDAAGVIDPEDAEWVDDDDYLDLYTPLGKREPNMHLLACLKTPRLTYSRYAQHNHLYGPILRSLDSASTSPDASGDGHSEELDEQKAEAAKGPISKFGYEGTHTCLLDRSGDALDVQLNVMQSRVVELETELALINTKTDMNPSTDEVRDLETRLRAAKMAVLRFQVYRDRRASTSNMPDGAEKTAQKAEYADSLFDREHIPEFHVFEDLDKWINRFMIHNPNVVISQRIRDILLRYYYSSRDRKLFNYAMSAKAVKFIKDMAKDYRDKAKHAMQKLAEESRQGGGHEPASSVSDQEPGVLDLLDSLIREATEARGSSTGHPGDYLPGRLLSKDPSSPTDKADVKDPMITLREQLATNERSQNSFLVSILKPQVCLCSEMGDQSSTVVIASQALQLRTCAILDIDHIDDPINAIVLHRNFARIDALQVFYPHLRGWRSGRKESLLSHANAFVPLELLAGLAASAKDLDTIVAPTNAHLTYDKNNRLRLVSRPKGSAEGRAAGCDRTVDRFNVTCDRFTVNATSTHFAAIYDVVTNLILYTDPNQKIKTQQIEANLLSKDFSDTADIAANLEKQQNVLRKLGGAYHKALESGPGLMSTSAEFDHDLMARSVTITARRDNLEMWLATLQRSQASRSSSRSTGLRLDARAQEIVWHMREGDGRPLAKVAVNGVYFRWQNRSDGGVSNSLVIRDLNALNSGVDPYFPEIISKHPYSQTVLETRFMKADIFVAVIWNTLGAVGGIEIIDHFQVHLHPIRLQMEQSMADKIKHYFFSEREKSNGDTASIMSASSLSSQPSSISLADSDSIKSKQMQLASRNRSTESLLSATPPPSKRPPSMIHGNLLNLPSSASSQTTLSSTRPSSIFKDTLHSPLDALVRGDENLDANDMRERARSNHTFLHVELFPTVLCLSFKGDKSTTLPDVYGLIYKSPTIIHCNRIWTYLDLLENIKKDFKSSIWSQSATLLGQLLTTARKPKNVVQQHVQQRLLGHVSERSGDRDRRRSFTSTIRSRLSSVGPEDSKVSPLRSSYVRHGVHEDDDTSDSDASDSHHIGRD